MTEFKLLVEERNKELKELKRMIDQFDDLHYSEKSKEAKKIKDLSDVLNYNLRKKSILDFIPNKPTKISTLKDFLKKDDIKNALKIAKTFKLSLNKEQLDILTRAFEMYSNKSFYEQLGFNFEEQLKLAKEILANIVKKV